MLAFSCVLFDCFAERMFARICGAIVSNVVTQDVSEDITNLEATADRLQVSLRSPHVLAIVG